MVKLLKSITKSIKHGLKNDPEVQRLHQKYPKFFNFIKKRLTPDEKYGTYLTIGIIFTLIFIYIFFGIIQDYIGQENLIQFDLRVINLFSTLRNTRLNQQMLFVTYLAKGEIITIGTLVFCAIFYLHKNWRFLYTLLISVVGGELFVWIIKNLVERPRPPLTSALVTESSYSFPSGHTFVAIAFYGLLSYFVVQSERKKSLKVISFIASFILIALIGISRVYLGAHWPSDVFASFAVGSAWLCIIITSLKIKKKFNPLPKIKIDTSKKRVNIFIFILISTWIIFIISFFITHPLQNKTIIETPKKTIESKQITNKLFEHLPKISESITALPAEPINIIIVGSQEKINQAFTQSGWYFLDGPGFNSYTKIITSIIFKQAYPQTPGLPVFWDTKTSDFAYGKPTSPNSISSREHIHFWQTDFITNDNQNIFVGTAHFDQAIQKKFGLIMPFHTTELKVDNERERIKTELESTNLIQKIEKVDLTGLMYGSKKGSGNSFLTDGQAYILYLK
jgi:undecaprenyl-diphosphatase